MKKYLLIFVIMGLIFISSCKEKNPHECTEGTWVFPEGTKCLEQTMSELICNECGKVIEIAPKKKSHHITIDEKEATCAEAGYYFEKCEDCDYQYLIDYDKTNNHKYYYEIYTLATDNKLGVKQQFCEVCYKEGHLVKYANNG